MFMLQWYSRGKRLNIQKKTAVLYLFIFRKLGSILLVTYLPTVLMNMINQATNYITTEDKYSLILQINITCMMVLASVYPPTSDIKPVEVWLLFNVAYPLIVMLTTIVLQVKDGVKH